GKVARYFYGIEYSARDLRFGLIEAAKEVIGSPVDQVLLLCYHYDPKNGKYSAVAMGAVRAGGVLTLLSLVTLFLLLWRGESKQRKLKRTLSSFAFLPLFPDAASADAQNIDNLFFFLLALCGFVALVIVCLILYFAIRYRRRTEDQLALWAGSVSWLE